MTWIHVGLSTGFVPKPIEALALLAVIGAAWAAQAKAEGWAFTAAAVGIAGTVGALFSELYPRVMISSTNAAYNLTIANTASPPYSLEGDDGGGGRLLPDRARLPGLGLPHLPQAPLGAAGGRRRRHGGRRTTARGADACRDLVGAQSTDVERPVVAQSPGLLCMMPPSAKIVVAVM